MFFEVLKQIFDTFGAAIFVPVVLFIVALFLKIKPKQAFNAARQCRHIVSGRKKSKHW
jgi:PTS system galactitol-specific IIC component